MASPSETSAASEKGKPQQIQTNVDADDRAKPRSKSKAAMQAGARKYPAPPFPKQHHLKLGEERKIDSQPLYDAPFYLGSKKLDGKIALITGGDSGIVTVSCLSEQSSSSLRIFKQFRIHGNLSR
ncbi:hypothetical protein [Foliimonas ilicis]